ncbi:hypothetical protein TNCT_397361 [Trichonephila clavata]|uniref:Uncharacterized protein n=1 Tax=Trichonephila clavata TaxID=2740835 RepID=A0A8X6JQS5_TRICU|nr:hypothetical protein TNCT_397361 [Trichonephila clavata]
MAATDKNNNSIRSQIERYGQKNALSFSKLIIITPVRPYSNLPVAMTTDYYPIVKRMYALGLVWRGGAERNC